MKCGRDIMELSAYLDNELTATQRAEVEQHLAQCAECRARIEDYRRIADGLAAMPRPVLSRSILPGVREAIASPDKPSDVGGWLDALLKPWWLKIPLEAAAVVAIVAGAMFLVRVPHREPAPSMSDWQRPDGSQAAADNMDAKSLLGDSDSISKRREAASREAAPLFSREAAPLFSGPATVGGRADDTSRMLRQTPAAPAPASTIEETISPMESIGWSVGRDSELTQQTVIIASDHPDQVVLHAVRLAPMFNGNIVAEQPRAKDIQKEGLKRDRVRDERIPVRYIRVELPSDQVAAFKSQLISQIEKSIPADIAELKVGTRKTGEVVASGTPMPARPPAASVITPPAARPPVVMEASEPQDKPTIAGQESRSSRPPSKPVTGRTQPPASVDIVAEAPMTETAELAGEKKKTTETKAIDTLNIEEAERTNLAVAKPQEWTAGKDSPGAIPRLILEIQVVSPESAVPALEHPKPE